MSPAARDEHYRPLGYGALPGLGGAEVGPALPPAYRGTCPCHLLPHVECPRAAPCLGGCGRRTTAFEGDIPGRCRFCAPAWGATARERVRERKVFDALMVHGVPQRVLDAGFAWRVAVREEGARGPSATAALERLAFELDEAVLAKVDAQRAVRLVLDGALWSAEGEVR